MDEIVVRRWGRSVESAKELCEDELKERLWREVWKKEIELPGVRWEVEEQADGAVEVVGRVVAGSGAL